MSFRTVVLGGTGFVGSHLVERLTRTQEIAVVSKHAKWPWGPPPSGATLLPLDLTRPDATEALAAIVAGSRWVINCTGALYRPSTPHETYAQLHLDATERISQALARSRTETSRLIHVSSTGVLGPTGTTPRDEETFPAPTNEYERTKLEGERIALGYRRPDREVTIVRPGLVYGPRDMHLLAWFKAIANGTYRPIGGGRALWQPIYAEDLARGIESTMSVPAADGQTFHMAGQERITIAALGARIGAAIGNPKPKASIPYALAMTAGTILEAAYAPFRADPPLSRARVRTMTEDRVYAIDRAKALLGFEPDTPLDRGLPETVAWYRAHGLLA